MSKSQEFPNVSRVDFQSLVKRMVERSQYTVCHAKDKFLDSPLTKADTCHKIGQDFIPIYLKGLSKGSGGSVLLQSLDRTGARGYGFPFGFAGYRLSPNAKTRTVQSTKVRCEAILQSCTKKSCSLISSLHKDHVICITLFCNQANPRSGRINSKPSAKYTQTRFTIMKPTPHVCIVGSLNVDFVTYTPRCPGPGETLTATTLAVNAGGKGANQAVACGRASFCSRTQQDVLVSMIGAVGSDDSHYSKLLKPVLEESGVSTTEIDELQNCLTGSATIIVEEEAGGQNRILVVPGANHSGMNDIEKIFSKIDSQTQRPGVLLLQGEIPRTTVLGLLQRYNNPDYNTHVVFNPAPVFEEGIPLGVLENTAVLIMNETEAMQMGRTIPGIDSSLLSEEEQKPEELAPYFHSTFGIRIVLITLGAKGVLFSTITGKRGTVPGVKVANVVDTTAAGDTFVGYFTTKFAKYVATGALLPDFDNEIELAVQESNAAAAICVQRKGAMQSIPFAYD